MIRGPLASPGSGLKPQTVCYLCGEAIDDDGTRDHVPPKQFFPESLRRKHELNLLTLPTHKACNGAFQKDEVYFVQSIGPLAERTYAGQALMENLMESFKYEEGAALYRKVLNEFRWDLNGIYLPPGLLAKSFDPERIHRVIWKITRGLYFVEKKRILRSETPNQQKIYSRQEAPEPGATMDRLQAALGHTKHPAAFDYKFIEATSDGGHPFHVWALLFWDALMWVVVFHDPACVCDGCVGLRGADPSTAATI